MYCEEETVQTPHLNSGGGKSGGMGGVGAYKKFSFTIDHALYKFFVLFGLRVCNQWLQYLLVSFKWTKKRVISPVTNKQSYQIISNNI